MWPKLQDFVLSLLHFVVVRDSPRPLLVLYCISLGNRSASSMLKYDARLSSGVKVFSSSTDDSFSFWGLFYLYFNHVTGSSSALLEEFIWRSTSCKETGMRGSCSIGASTYVGLVARISLFGLPIATVAVLSRLFHLWSFAACGLGFLVFL